MISFFPCERGNFCFYAPFCGRMKGMKSYNSLNDYYRKLFGEKTFKVPIDAGFDCPNRDGTVAHGGCTFCTVSGSGDAIVAPDAPIREQFYKEIDFMHRKWPDVRKYLVYFQNFTNTHEKLEVIRERYEQAINEPGVVGLNIGTRPDCLPDETIAYLADLSERMHVTVELGLQTTYEETSDLINRAHSYELYVETVQRVHKLAPKAEIVSQALKYNIGTSDDHPGRYHLKDTIRVRRRVPSGAKHDRQTYEIYSTVPERFIPAATQLEKRRLAITKAIQSAGTRG